MVDNAAKMKSQQVIAYFATLQLRNPDSMKGIRRGSTPPVGQKVRDSLLNYRKDCLTVFNAIGQETVQSAQDIRSG